MLKKFFNWAAGQPSSQYTLGGHDLSFKFNRAGRLAERVFSAKGLIVGGALALLGLPLAITGALPTAVAAVTVGSLIAAFGKATGLMAGGIAHLAAAGTNGVVKHISQGHAPKA